MNRFFVLCRWETDTYPGFHVDGPQGLIDSILNIEDCDVFIGIFWTRFGTPVAGALSGTEHEFQRAFRAWERKKSPQLLFYFSEKCYRLDTEEQVEQLKRVLKFKREFPPSGLWWSYKNPTQFKETARRHLLKLMQDIDRGRVEAKPRNSVISTIFHEVSTQFDLPEGALVQKSNRPNIALPRQIAMYLTKELTNLSLPEIGRRFGNKHHTTVMHSLAKIEHLCRTDTSFSKTIEDLKHLISEQK